MINPIARFLAWRRERRAFWRVVLAVHEDGRRLVRGWAALRFIDITDEQWQAMEGKTLTCIFCKRPFKYRHKTCAPGFCQRCSK